MTTSIDINTYCKDPQKWSQKLSYSSDTTEYWNQICDLRKTFSPNELKKDLEQFGVPIKELGKAVPEAIEEMMMSMLEPANLGVMAGFIGASILTKKGWKMAVEQLAKGMTAEMTEALGEVVAKEGASIAAGNASAALSTLISVAWQTEGKLGAWGLGVLLKGAEKFANIIPVLGEVMMLLQLTGMIFDAWDPCHLNDQLNKDTIHQYNNQFNTVFRQTVLVQLESHIDAYGNKFYFSDWPILFHADRSIMQSEKQKVYGPLMLKYMTRYLNAKQFNSLGQPLCWPQDGELINNNAFRNVSKRLALSVSGNNTVIANWAIRLSPVLAFLGVLVIILIYKVINGKLSK